MSSTHDTRRAQTLVDARVEPAGHAERRTRIEFVEELRHG